MATKLESSAIAGRMSTVPQWKTDGDSLTRSLKFRDHVEAFGFVTRVAMIAEKMDHHPDLRIVYNNVDLVLSSHDAGGVTEMDFELAKRIDGLLGT